MVSKAIDAVKDRTEVEVVEEACRHHWVIETADGPTSRGVCRRCGMVKEFMNSIPDDVPQRLRDKGVFRMPELKDVAFNRENNTS